MGSGIDGTKDGQCRFIPFYCDVNDGNRMAGWDEATAGAALHNGDEM